MRTHLAVWPCLLLLANLSTAQQPGYVAEWPDPPREVVERTGFEVTVRYRAPDGAPAVALRCEMKDARGEVIAQERRSVAGSGTLRVRFMAPGAAESPEVQLAVWMGDDWRQSYCPIVHTRPIAVVTAVRADVVARRREAAKNHRARLAARRGAQGLVALYQPPSADWPRDLAAALASSLQQAGCAVEHLDDAAVVNPDLLLPEVIDLLILADSRTMPAEAMKAVSQYADRGGRLMVLGGPAFSRLLYPWAGQWLAYSDYVSAVAQSLPVQVALNFETSDAGPWVRATNDAKPASRCAREANGAKGTAGCLRVDLANNTGWDTFASPSLPNPFGSERTWTCFWAKGAASTPEFALEWDEADGSRWIAVVPLTTQWRPYALPPSAFKLWTGPDSRRRDTFQPRNAVRFSLGVADTHTRLAGHGAHTIWLDEFGTSGAPAGDDAAALTGPEPPVPAIEAVSPRYKVYPVTNAANYRVDPAGLLAAPTAALPRPATALSPHPRPDGSGLHKGRPWRFAPLYQALDERGDVAGSPVALVLNGAEGRSGGVVVSAPIADPAFFAAPATRDWLVQVARRLLDGLFLYEGGAAWYASFGGEDVPVGAVVTNRGLRPNTGTIHAEVTNHQGQTVWSHDWPVTVPAGGSLAVSAPCPIAAGATGPFKVAVELRRGQAAIDRLAHELRVWRPNANPRWVTVKDGDFVLDGRPWILHGVNYMPSSGIGTEEGPYFESWVSAKAYDPAIIERDLARVERIGFNMVSVFIYHDALSARNLLDLLMRCEDHHLKANVSLRPGTPMDFLWPQMREIVTKLRLGENDTVFAYDLAWEPNWGARNDLVSFDAGWRAWIARRHGSVEAAERAWQHAARREGGQVVGPDNDQLSKEGPWLKMVVDYRQYLNDLLAEKYGAARRLMRSIAPNQLVSFRMSGSGDPLWMPPHSSYDFAGLAQAVDFNAPEGYGRIGAWDRVRVGLWTTAYARACAPQLPVIWAEFGNTIWSSPLNGPDPARIADTARFYDDFYRMVDESDGNGTICWWYPGGYRVNERSDFGIINPDGSWRPITEVIARWAPKFAAPRAKRRVDPWIEFDPARSVRGLTGIYEATQAEFWKAVDAGRRPGLRRRP